MKTKGTVLILTLALAALFAHRASAWAESPLASDEHACYSIAMVGFDSVINSRIGVPPEHVVELATAHGMAAQGDQSAAADAYSTYLLKVMLDAYLWQHSPHSYAVKVFYRCAVANADGRAALAN